MKKIFCLLLCCVLSLRASFDPYSLHDGLMVGAAIASGFAAVIGTWALWELSKMNPKSFKHMKVDVALHGETLGNMNLAIEGLRDRINLLEQGMPPPYVSPAVSERRYSSMEGDEFSINSEEARARHETIINLQAASVPEDREYTSIRDQLRGGMAEDLMAQNLELLPAVVVPVSDALYLQIDQP